MGGSKRVGASYLPYRLKWNLASFFVNWDNSETREGERWTCVIIRVSCWLPDWLFS